MGELGGRRAEGGDGSHNLGGVCDILKGGDASGDGENGGSGELHFDGLGGLVLEREDKDILELVFSWLESLITSEIDCKSQGGLTGTKECG